MYLDLTEEQKLIQETARQFAQAELAPAADRLDRGEDQEVFLTNLKKLAELGFMGLNVKEEYGGAQAGMVAFSAAITEIARACASTAVTVSVNNLICNVIQAIGSEAQKKAYISKICSGEYKAGSFALSEPGAGSDAAAITTSAVLDGDEWVLNGAKRFISSAPYAGVFLTWAVTDKSAPKGKGISCFLVEAGTKGLIVGRAEEKMGQHASSTNEVIFEDCRIPKEALLGKLNDGLRTAVKELPGGRVGIGSLALGVGLAAMDYATRYAKNRVQFGQEIVKFEAIQWMIADAYTELEAARLLLMQAAFRADQGRAFTKEAAMAKLFAAEAANRACYSAIQMMGGYGYSREFPLERYARDVRVTSIYEGTSEIQRMIIAKEILKSLEQS
ncbi:MAG: acyl-CoA dehydrogenase family protein [Chloroflexota bacterium]